MRNKYYNLNAILKTNSTYNVIIGERSNGKTYACLKYGIEQYFKDNWTRFFMVKSVPYGDLMSIGISFEQILNMVNEIAKSKIIFEDYKSI